MQSVPTRIRRQNVTVQADDRRLHRIAAASGATLATSARLGDRRTPGKACKKTNGAMCAESRECIQTHEHRERTMQNDTNDNIGNLIELINAGVELWTQAGEMLIRLRLKKPSIYADVMREDPRITVDMLATLEGIAHKRIYPYLLLSNNNGFRRLLEMPYADQVRYYKEPVELFVGHDSAHKPLIAHRMVAEMSPKEIAQAFGMEGVRSIKEQMAIHKDKAPVIVTAPSTEKIETFRIQLTGDGEFHAEPIKVPISQTVLLKQEGDKLVADVTFFKQK